MKGEIASEKRAMHVAVGIGVGYHTKQRSQVAASGVENHALR